MLFPFCSNASIDIAFIEQLKPNGQTIKLEPNGLFAHIAISYQGYWLHSHPYRGVELISQSVLEKMGTIKTVITVSEKGSLKKKQIDKYLGKPYDSEFSWSDDKIYCSELIAKLLKINPQPMTFDIELWPKSFQNSQNQLGLSPDDLFHILKRYGYQERSLKSYCSNIFM